MRPGEKEYGITKKDYHFAGFTRPQDDMKHGYDWEHEDHLVVKCNEAIAEVFCDPNIFERRIAKHEKTPITCPATKDLYGNIIYTDDPEYYCAGSGDTGGGKVFWTPYSTQDMMLREKLLADDMCDNCKTLAHELQHGIGSHAEFDSLSDIPELLFRVDNFPKNQRLEHHLTSIYMSMERVAAENRMPWYLRSRRNVFCSLMTRRPKQYREILRADGWAGWRIDETVRKLCKI